MTGARLGASPAPPEPLTVTVTSQTHSESRVSLSGGERPRRAPGGEPARGPARPGSAGPGPARLSLRPAAESRSDRDSSSYGGGRANPGPSKADSDSGKLKGNPTRPECQTKQKVKWSDLLSALDCRIVH